VRVVANIIELNFPVWKGFNTLKNHDESDSGINDSIYPVETGEVK